jgi:hypothetical protein
LIRRANYHAEGILGFVDDVWWRRLAQPNRHRWAARDEHLRLIANQRAPDDRNPKALAWYGVRLREAVMLPEQVWVRFATGQPASDLTPQLLAWCGAKLAATGIRGWVLLWANASWHTSKQVRSWIRAHNRTVKQTGCGVRILPCYLPTKSPWLTAIEPNGMHGTRAVLEPERVLTTDELEARVYADYRCAPDSHLVIPDKAA